LLLFACKQILLIALFGPFTGHDEVDHYWYIARLGSGDGLGVVGEVVLPPETRPYRGYVADYPSNAEVIQPPLYHAALAPIWRILPGDAIDRLFVLRFASVVLGLAVVLLAYLTARALFPESPFMRAGVPLFVAFQPQLAFEAAIVNHDILVIALFSLLVYLLLRGLTGGFSSRRELAVGLVTAAGLWTKLSFGLALPVIVLAVVWTWWDNRRRWGDLVTALQWLVGSLFLTVGLPLLLLAPWFLRSFWLYGDPTGTQRLREIQEFGSSASTYQEMFTTPAFWRERLEDFWGNYGWRNIPYDASMSQTIWALWGIAVLIGLFVLVREVAAGFLGWRRLLTRDQVRGMTVVAASVLMLAFGVLYVGTIQFTQSRFIFPAMIGIAMISLIGVDRVLPARARPIATPVLLALLVLFNVVALVRFVIPFYYGPGGGGVLLP
jgi:4-amino-4-deoxy-L-arabinose transferase-like glycosyltransferase